MNQRDPGDETPEPVQTDEQREAIKARLPKPNGPQALIQLLDRWNSGEGKPYKGQLIDWSAYEDNPESIGCMCAQGQVLHVLGGWEPERLRNVEQEEADKATAQLLNISVAHAVLLRVVNDKVDGAPSIVLTDPGKVLGSEWSNLLDFWWHVDQMSEADWRDFIAVWDAAGAARVAARIASWDAAAAVADEAAALVAVGIVPAARDVASAASEIQGAHLLRERGKPFFFLPMFGFADPEAIPARPANYGEASLRTKGQDDE